MYICNTKMEIWTKGVVLRITKSESSYPKKKMLESKSFRFFILKLIDHVTFQPFGTLLLVYYYRYFMKYLYRHIVYYFVHKVAPAELEALINTHPAIADVAVVGVPDERAGELPRAFCVLKNGMEASEDDVRRFVKGM